MTLSQTLHVHLNPTKYGLEFTVRPTDPYTSNPFATMETSFLAKIQYQVCDSDSIPLREKANSLTPYLACP
jgi:hypothetical protein